MNFYCRAISRRWSIARFTWRLLFGDNAYTRCWYPRFTTILFGCWKWARCRPTCNQFTRGGYVYRCFSNCFFYFFIQLFLIIYAIYAWINSKEFMSIHKVLLQVPLVIFFVATLIKNVFYWLCFQSMKTWNE